MNHTLYINGYRFELVSFACPEAYDVYDIKGDMVCYVRLRHGKLTAHCPDYGKDLIYIKRLSGSDGCFKDADEAFEHLEAIVVALQKYQYKNIMNFALE